MIQLDVLSEHGEAESFRFSKEIIFLGRDAKNDIFIDDSNASRHHARLVRTARGYELEDLGSLNGTNLNGEKAGRANLWIGDTIEIGGHRLTVVKVGSAEEASATDPSEEDLDKTKIASYSDSAPTNMASDWTITAMLGEKRVVRQQLKPGVTTIGRDPSSDIVLADDDVSRHHARVICKHGKYYLEDLDSLNGTYVGGEPVYTCKLAAETEIDLGPYKLRIGAQPGSTEGNVPGDIVRCKKCQRFGCSSWSNCPYCRCKPRNRQDIRLHLLPLKARDPFVEQLSPGIHLTLQAETVAMEKQWWVSLPEPPAGVHPIGEVPSSVYGCEICFLTIPEPGSLRLCPRCSNGRLGQLDISDIISKWCSTQELEISLRNAHRHKVNSTRAEVSIRWR